MATNSITGRENLVNAARMTHNQEIIDVAEVLNEEHVIADFHVERGNDITSHVIGRRTGLPSVSWVKIGNGWTASIGTTNQVREEMGQLHARYQCPTGLMDIQPNPAKFRTQQERPFVEAMSIELSDTLFGNFSAGALSPTVKPPEEFAGFQYRYGSLGSTRDNYVISNGHTVDDNTNTSIWFIQHGPGKVYLTFPRNMEGGGLKKMDKGIQFVPGDNITYTNGVSNNNMLYAYVTEFEWNVGLVVEDMRCVKRLCNIDPDRTATNSLNEDYIIEIRNNFTGNTPPVMYVNETIQTQLDILAKDKSNVWYSPNSPWGENQLMFKDMPVRRCDAITDVEPVIT